MATVLVLVPIKRNAHPELTRICRANLAGLTASNPAHVIETVTDSRGPGDAGVRTLAERVAHTCTIRQGMVDDYLSPRHDYVLWVDADVARYPADLPSALIERGRGNVAAPVVHLDGSPNRFYDIAGFVEQGRWANLHPPHFSQKGPEVKLDGVGCVYLVPADVYRKGARHVPVPGYTDHLAVCRKARELGYEVLAFTDLIAYHANLTGYGERHH